MLLLVTHLVLRTLLKWFILLLSFDNQETEKKQFVKVKWVVGGLVKIQA